MGLWASPIYKQKMTTKIPKLIGVDVSATLMNTRLEYLLQLYSPLSNPLVGRLHPDNDIGGLSTPTAMQLTGKIY